jgi:hypothetical protein
VGGAVGELKKGKSKLGRGQTDPQIRIDGAIQRAMNANEPGFRPAELRFDRIERMYLPAQSRGGVSGPDWDHLQALVEEGLDYVVYL